jgi:PTH2 family peptidyl-tRNA hydrolase
MQTEMKQCIVIRADLGLSRGKAAVQAAHAAILSYEAASKVDIRKWKEEGQKKVVLKLNSEEEIYKLKEEAERLGLPFAIVEDAGLTEIPPGTVTAIGIGPASEEEMDKVTGKLQLF